MRINEIFYSLQGEGINTGRAAIFIRLSGCNLRCAYCDTDFTSGEEMTDEQLLEHIAQYPGRFLIWTGGEPTLQLREQTVELFHKHGYTQAIETNGTRPVPRGIDYITCSPKPEAMNKLLKNFPDGVGEFRFPLSADSPAPPPISELPRAGAYLISPIFVGDDAHELDYLALERCIEYVKANPEWRLSLQTHKLIHIR